MGHPIRVGCSEKYRHHRSLGYSEKCRAFDTNRIHHGANIVGAFLKCRRPGDSVGEALATLVERDDCREPREATQKSGIARNLMHHLDMRDHSRHDQQAKRTMPHYLIGNAYRTRTGKSCLWQRLYVSHLVA